MSARIAVGIGCRRGIAASAVIALVRETLASGGLGQQDAAMFTIDAKRDEAGLAQAAETLGLPLIFLSRAVLACIDTPTQSSSSQAMFGVSSVAEAAALAGAGQGAALVVPRVARDAVTCAIARSVG